MRDPAQSCSEKKAGRSPAPLSAHALPDILRQVVEMNINATDDKLTELPKSQRKFPQLHWSVREQNRGAFRLLTWDSPPRPFTGRTRSPYPAQGLRVLARLGGWLKQLIANIHSLCGPRINGADGSRAGCQAQQLNQPPWVKPVSPKMSLSHKCALLDNLPASLSSPLQMLTFAHYSLYSS